jgi:membrane-associated phospholipid phosphatase
MRAFAFVLHVETHPTAGKRQPGWSQLLVVAGAFGFYELAHLLTDQRRRAALWHAREVLSLERLLGIDWEHSAQSVSLHSAILLTAANGIYTWMYWPVIFGALVLTWRFDRRYYAVLRDGMLLSGAAGLLVFIFYPVAPPRMLPRFTNTIANGSLEHAVVHGSIADSYAALPSFHAGWVALGAAILALSAGRSRATPGRTVALGLAVVTSALMAAAVVVTANHFVLDALSGIGLALGCGYVAARLHHVADRRDQPVSTGRRIIAAAMPEPNLAHEQ